MVKEFISQLPPDKLTPFAKHPYTRTVFLGCFRYLPESVHRLLVSDILVQRLCDIYSSSVYVQGYLFPLSFVFQTWILLLCYFSCGRQTCFDCSTGGLSFPTHRLSLFYSTGIARGCLFSTKQSAQPPFSRLRARFLLYRSIPASGTQASKYCLWIQRFMV